MLHVVHDVGLLGWFRGWPCLLLYWRLSHMGASMGKSGVFNWRWEYVYKDFVLQGRQGLCEKNHFLCSHGYLRMTKSNEVTYHLRCETCVGIWQQCLPLHFVKFIVFIMIVWECDDNNCHQSIFRWISVAFSMFSYHMLRVLGSCCSQRGLASGSSFITSLPN